MSTQPTKLPPVALTLTTERVGTLWTNDVVERTRAGGAQIVEVRTPKECSGEDIRAIRGGHVVGAVSIPCEANWKDPATPAKLAAKQVSNKDGMSLKPADDLKALYAKLDPAKETAVVLRDLGFSNVKVYEPSWLGYAGARGRRGFRQRRCAERPHRVSAKPGARPARRHRQAAGSHGQEVVPRCRRGGGRLATAPAAAK